MRQCLILQWLHEVLAPGYSLWDRLGKISKKHNNRVGLWRLAWRWKKSDDCPLSETLTAPHFDRRRNQVFLTKNLYTEELLHKETCTRCLHTVAFMHRSFCTEKSLPIFHHVSSFRIIHHLSSSYLCFHALRRLVFISHGVLPVHASSWLPLRWSKLNENPGINSD